MQAARLQAASVAQVQPQGPQPPTPERDAGGQRAAPEAADTLTRKELEILRLVAEGKSNQEIADALFSSLPTVKWHVRNILAKLEARGRVAAIAIARSRRLIP